MPLISEARRCLLSVVSAAAAGPLLECRPFPAPLNCCSGTIPDQWGGLEGWEVVRLRHNKLSGTLPAGKYLQLQQGDSAL